MNTSQVIDISQLFKKTFGNIPYNIPELSTGEKEPGELYQLGSLPALNAFTPQGSLLKEAINGVDVLLPVRFYSGPALLMHLPYVVVNLRNKKIIVRTPMSERTGSVKEQYSIDDWEIGIKGFIISEDRQFPEALLRQLNALYKTSQAVTLDNALTNIFLTDPALTQEEQRRVVIEDIDIPEVQGGRVHVRPFSLKVISDSVFTLEYDE